MANGIERVLGYVLGGIGLLLAILDFVGLLDRVPWLAAKTDALILGILALLLTVLTQMLGSADRSARELRDVRKGLEGNALGRVAIEGAALGSAFERRAAAVLVGRLRDLIERRRLTLLGGEQFRLFYGERLRELGRGDVVRASSLTSRSYFWGSADIDQAVRDFVGRGGVMKRVFFTADPQGEHVKPVLDHQAALGVRVFTCDPRDVPTDARRLLFLDERDRFAWEVRTHSGAEDIQQAEVTTDPAGIAEIRDGLNTLRATAVLRPYGGHADSF